MQIREASLKERSVAAAVLALQLHVYGHLSRQLGGRHLPSQDARIGELLTSNERILLAYDKQRLVGVISARRHGEAIEIVRLFTHPDYGRSGIATRLFERLGEAESDARIFRVFLAEVNEPAQRFFEKQNFAPAARVRRDGLDLRAWERARAQPWPQYPSQLSRGRVVTLLAASAVLATGIYLLRRRHDWRKSLD